MKKLIAIFLFSIVVSLTMNAANQQKEYVDYVNPLIETTKSRYFYFSSACRPFGMVNLSPDMVLSGAWNSGYRYQEPYVRGLTHLHMWGVSGLLMMPVTGKVDPRLGAEEWKSEFQHEKEQAKAGYHQLYLDKYNVNVELTSTTRVGMHRYTFEKDNEADVLIYLGGWIGPGVMTDSYFEKTGDQEISGWVNQHHFGWTTFKSKLFFVIQTDTPIDEADIWQDNKSLEKFSGNSHLDSQGLRLHFKNILGKQVQFKVGLSWCGVDQAKLNLNTELTHWDFEKVKQDSRDEWNKWLSKIEVKGGTEDQKTKFYTDLWHSLLGRRQIQDVDGKYPNYMNGELQVGQLPLKEDGTPRFWHHNSDAWWLTMWNLNTLWGIAYPEILDNIVNSSMIYYKDGGHLPRGPLLGRYSWIMTGSAITELIVGSYNKGIRNYDAEAVYQACVKAHMPGSTMDMINGKLSDYIDRGFIPEDKVPHVWGGAGRVMENVSQDWALAQFAKELGKTDDYNYFMKRSANWLNHFDPEVGFIRAKNEDGSWFKPFDPIMSANYAGFVEANSWQSTWIAVHDVQALANLLGGNDKYTEKLNYAFEHSKDKNFVGGHGNSIVNYANQPGCAMAHMFNYAGAPWLTQKWVREVQSRTYSGVTPYSGYGGYDEDQGQMGALSAMMSIGLFQVRGGCDKDAIYEITSPIFDEIVFHLDDKYYKGKKFTIRTVNNSKDNMYIQSASLNGAKLDNCWFTHNTLVNGGELVLTMGATPNKSWGVNQLPPSETKVHPNYKLSNIKFIPKVKAGEDYEISYTVENTGGVGTFFAKIALDKREITRNPILLRSGEKQEIKQKIKFFDKGTHNLLVEGQNVGQIKVSARKSELLTQRFNTKTVGEKINISASLWNFGSDRLTHKYPLLIDGKEVNTHNVDLIPGDSVSFIYTHTVDKTGEYKVEFAGNTQLVRCLVPTVRKENNKIFEFDMSSSYPQLDISGNSLHDERDGDVLDTYTQEGMKCFKPTTGNYLKLMDNNLLNQQHSLTICAWLYPLQRSNNGSIVQKGYDDNQYVVRYIGSDKFYFKMFGVQGGELQAKVPETDKWSFVVCQYDSKERLMQIWINGEKVAERAASGEIDITHDPLFIGAKKEHCDPDQVFQGYIRKVTMLNRFLKPNEIKSYYQKP